MAEQLEFYFPKSKSKHMAIPTTGKVYPSKGGTVRYGVQASMNGYMSLPKYVKENKFYDYGFGVDSVVRKYPQEFIDVFYDFDSHPTADTQDDETVELAYQVWYQKQAENEVLNAEVSVGEKQVKSRKDYDIANELSGFSNMEVGDINLEDYEDEITESVEDEVIEAIRESVDENMPISDGDSVSSYVNVDTELEITVPISGDIDYDWTANETHEEEVDDEEWNAESLDFHGENYQNHLKVIKKAPYGGIGSLFGIGGDTELGGFSTGELTGSSAIHGDFDSASLNYSGHQNLQVRAESFSAEKMGWVLTHPKMGRSGVFALKDDAEKVKNWHIRNAPSHYENETSMKIVKANANDGDLGKHSKSIVESFNAEMDESYADDGLDYTKVKKLTDSFMSKNPTIIGEYGPFGYYKLYEHPVRGDTDFLYFYTPAMGGLLVQSALHHKDQMNDKDAAIVSNNLVKLLKQNNLYHTDFFGDENQLNINGLYEGTENVYFAESFNAEMEDSPSPSSPLEEVPATVPSPAEPTNESMRAENEKVYRGMPTDPDIPTILIDGPFGKEMWAFYEDGKLNKDPKQYQNRDGEMCAACEGDISLEYARSSRGYRYCEDCWEMVSFTKKGYHAEMDELSEDTSIIRNQVGDMVGMVELDENDEDIEKVDIDIIDDDGEMAYEGTLGAETFEAQPNFNEETQEYDGTIKEIYKDPKTNTIRVKGRWYYPQIGEWVEYNRKGCQFEGCAQMYSPEWEDDDYCTSACANGMTICGKNKPYSYDLKSVADSLAGQMMTVDGWEDGAYGDFCQSLTEDVVYDRDGEEQEKRIMCNDCDYEKAEYGAETFESQGTNTKMILGITALAVGLGLWKGKEIMSISEKISQSIKNMKK